MPLHRRGVGTDSFLTILPSGLQRLLGFFTSRVIPIFVTSFNALLTVWRMALQWLNGYILYMEYGGRPANDFYHKAVLIGDGLAQGFGAWVSFACASGPMRYLNEGAALNPAIKMDWVFFERGARHSTTDDWLPPGAKQGEDVGVGSEAEEKERHKDLDDCSRQGLRPSSFSLSSSSSLLQTVLTSRSGRDVCLFIVMVGLQDILRIKDPDALLALAAAAEKEETSRETNKGMHQMFSSSSPGTNSTPQEAAAEEPFCQTVLNLRCIVLHLLSLPHAPHVCLCTLPTVGAPSSIRARAIKGVNAQIVRMVRNLPPAATQTHQGEQQQQKQQQQQQQKPRVTLVELSQRRVSRAEGRAFDGVHLTSSGYKSLSAAILDELAPAMVRHEWSILQEYVSGRKTRMRAGGRKGWFGRGWMGEGGKERNGGRKGWFGRGWIGGGGKEKTR
ncbi:Hypothetical protein NocV09_01000810 [Nannochloropsis oceanica]